MRSGSNMNPFVYLNSINVTKEDIMVDEEAEKGYNAFIINRSLSYFTDTIFLANEMNLYHNLDNRLQYDFFINSIRKRKRFSKFMKADTFSKIDVIKAYYNYSNDKARQVVNLFTDKQIEVLKHRMDKGGTRSTTKQKV